MKYCAAYYSDIGIQKETNQDSLLLVQRGQTQDDEAVLAVICDGVGGVRGEAGDPGQGGRIQENGRFDRLCGQRR